MYIDWIILGNFGWVLVLIIWGLAESRIKYKRLYEQVRREDRIFKKQKTDREITESIVTDAINIGLPVKDCSSVGEIVYGWYYWNNYKRDYKSHNPRGMERDSFDMKKPRRDNAIDLPQHYRVVEIDIENLSNYYKAKP